MISTVAQDAATMSYSDAGSFYRSNGAFTVSRVASLSDPADSALSITLQAIGTTTKLGRLVVLHNQSNLSVRSAANFTSGFFASVDTVRLDSTAVGGTQSAVFNQTSMVITDTVNTKGMEYAADYSANFTDRSLVDKAYVDAQGGGGARSCCNLAHWQFCRCDTDRYEFAEDRKRS